MKKQLKNFGGIFLLGASLTACISEQTEDFLELSREKGVEVRGNTLRFTDFESYENAIKNPKEILSLDFRSISTLGKAGSATSTARILSDEESNALKEFQGTVILEILDEDGMMIIGDKLFHLDFVNRLVAVTSDFSLRELLINRTFESEKINLFSFDDDVIGTLEENENYLDNRNKNNADGSRIQSCPVQSGPLVPNVSTDCAWNVCTWASEYIENNFLYRAEAKNTYQSAGVYFRLKTEIKHMRRQLGTTSLFVDTSADLAFQYVGYFKSKRNGSVQRNLNTCMTNQEPADFGFRMDKVHYEDIRGLDYFELGTTFNAHLGGVHAFSGYPDSFELRKIKKS
jgi:hypothetical protein